MQNIYPTRIKEHLYKHGFEWCAFQEGKGVYYYFSPMKIISTAFAETARFQMVKNKAKKVGCGSRSQPAEMLCSSLTNAF